MELAATTKSDDDARKKDNPTEAMTDPLLNFTTLHKLYGPTVEFDE